MPRPPLRRALVLGITVLGLLLALWVRREGGLRAALLSLQLSEKGMEACRQIQKAETFSGPSVGYAGTTPPVVLAFRTLLQEKDADAAFKMLVAADGKASLPARLYALCGLWFTDQTAFKEQVARFRTMKGSVWTIVGCIGGNEEIADLVECSAPDSIRLRGPHETMKEYWTRQPNAGRGDIAGGYWPSVLKGD